jgi:hypothetical protein|tara:strand:+ start:145 stop:369 length:225 start_codon:yes stop_codon:yes gene_type:complete
MTQPHEQRKDKHTLPFSEAELVARLTPYTAHADALAPPSPEELEHLGSPADGETSRLKLVSTTLLWKYDKFIDS